MIVIGSINVKYEIKTDIYVVYLEKKTVLTA